MKKCWCGTGKNYDKCCGPLLKGAQVAQTPEQLMRSRYSAFCERRLDYLWETTDARTRLPEDKRSYQDWATQAKFLGLKVIRAKQNGDEGEVEFEVTYFQEGFEQKHREHSHFRREAERWYYCAR